MVLPLIFITGFVLLGLLDAPENDFMEPAYIRHGRQDK